MNTINSLGVLLVLISLLTTFCCGIQPSYQVTLYVHLHPRGPPIHLCNGVIVQSRLVLTTASCVHYQFSSSSPITAIVPTMISMTGGHSTPFSEELSVEVAEILLAKNFNYTTGENDLALLRLNSNLPLNTRNDIKWIILDDADIYDGPCLVNLYVETSADGLSNYIQSEELPILDSELCGTRTEYAVKRVDDICSFYYPTTGFNCNNFERLQNYIEDRGMGFVCENKLIGVLSTVLPMQNRSDCMENPIKAYYTSLAPHLEWIYNIITEEEMKMINKGLYMSSSPYAGETNAFVQPDSTAPGSTVAYVAANTTIATQELSVKHSSAPRVNKINFLPVIFGIYLLLRSLNSN